MNKAQPLKITAKLLNGFACSDPWSPSIDGILAYWMLRERLGEQRFIANTITSENMAAVTGLPLAVQRDGGLWWYLCSSPQYSTLVEHLRYYHRRMDVQFAERYMIPPKGRISTKAGPYKNYRLMTRINTCPEVIWHVVGNQMEIKRLLVRCTHIGARVGAGNGEVIKWQVTEDGDPFLASLERPLPMAFAEKHG
ncbi:MAG: hypothetical protein P1P81_09220, partial [Desulfobulbales bacterium]|nr:hypothetical protein [Desulfobulbales bacterium]